MTCVIGMLGNDDEVWMGADSLGGTTYTHEIRKDSKIFINGDYLIGFTSSFRMGQLLMYGKLPAVGKTKNKNMFKFMVTKFIPAVRKILKNGGYLTISENLETGGDFLVGVNGHIFRIAEDLQVQESVCEIVACGCGEDLALSSMKTMESLDVKMSCEEKIRRALNITCQISSHVKPPFHVMNI
jgi:ATP-dependent protease HslVU (ClpYQ) peptidase subunit